MLASLASRRAVRGAFSTAAVRASVWKGVTLGPPDPILGITVAFNNDKHPKKINLGVGAYRDDNNKPFELECVRKAEKEIVGKMDHEYAGISGVPAFVDVTAKLALGDDSKLLKEKRVATSQTISGTGAVRVGVEFIKRFYPGVTHVAVPVPTWGNHLTIITDSGLKVAEYKYYDKATRGLDFAGMKQSLNDLPNNSVVLLHACAHNPTGVDPSPEQWKELSALFKTKNHFPFFDMAYQGFASGDPERDAAALRLFAKDGHQLAFCQSYAKNFGLYGERIGALSFTAESEEEKTRIDSRLKMLIRPMYSNPPIHGGRIVAKILSDKDLTALWRKEVKGMADRIISMRQALVSNLKKAGSSKDWSHITKQIGMFCYSGLNTDQVNRLEKEFHIYLTKDGRISMAGVTTHNVQYLAESIHTVSK